MKIIGLMLTWNNLEFLRCSLPQALSFCDELIVVEGCHSQQYPKRSTDGTCEYIESIRGLPKLRVMDFAFKGRYDKVQRQIRQEIPRESVLYEPGNWIIHWDDDTFFFSNILTKLKIAMQKAKRDSLAWSYRHFIYNFRFSMISNCTVCYRIIDGLYLRGVSRPHYPNGKQYQVEMAEGIGVFHYGYVKKPERFNARVVMSVEKGTKSSREGYEWWMDIKWDKDEDILKSKAFIDEKMRFNGGLHIYNGEHPKAVANHPWRYINDVREMK